MEYVTNYITDSKKNQFQTTEKNKVAIDLFDDKGIRDSDGSFKFYPSDSDCITVLFIKLINIQNC